jgi:hypothetical protein
MSIETLVLLSLAGQFGLAVMALFSIAFFTVYTSRWTSF